MLSDSRSLDSLPLRLKVTVLRTAKTEPPARALGRADPKYHHHGLVPHSLLLFSTVLYNNTTPSAHRNLPKRPGFGFE